MVSLYMMIQASSPHSHNLQIIQEVDKLPRVDMDRVTEVPLGPLIAPHPPAPWDPHRTIHTNEMLDLQDMVGVEYLLLQLEHLDQDRKLKLRTSNASTR